MEDVRVKVNVLNQLRLYRQSTFKDKLCFLDEDIQNAQRAKATEVRITTHNNRLEISNNGKPLTNPQALFSMADSDWDEEVTKSENPFGLGFFSNISVSNYLEIFSGEYHIVFDIDQMLSSGDTKVVVEVLPEEEWVEKFVDGFKLVLHNFDYNEIYQHQIAERASLLGAYVHELDVYYNDTQMEKKDLTQGDGSQFLLKIEGEETFKGWIAFTTMFSSEINVFYKGRLVKKLEDIYYLKGDLHISDKTLNLTAPDRKDIIRDGKYQDFATLIRLYAEELGFRVSTTASQKAMESYVDALSWYTNFAKVKNLMKFLVLKGQNVDNMKYLEKVIKAKRDAKGHSSFVETEAYIRSEANVQSESHFEEIIEQREPDVTAPEARGSGTSSGGYGGSSYRPEITDKETTEESGEEIFQNTRPKFWISHDEVLKFEDKLNMVKHYDLFLIVARNRFEKSVLEKVAQDGTIIHISKLQEKITIESTLSNTELDIKEQRALMLLDMISRMAGFSRNVFAIGDLMVTRTLEIPEIDVKETRIEEDVIAILNKDVQKIYIDRASIKKSKLVTNISPRLNLNDYKFILANAKEFSEELKLMKDSKDDMFESLIASLGGEGVHIDWDGKGLKADGSKENPLVQ